MAKQSASTTTFSSLMADIKARKFAPIYLLMGEESYYIDKACDLIAETVLTEEEQAFNQMTIYCTRETDYRDIINNAKRYPMMSEYQVVIVKEAQNLQKIEELVSYTQTPLGSTILVICHKNGNVDKRKKVVASIAKNGVIFESPKVGAGQLPTFIVDYLKAKQTAIDNKAVMMLAENIGSDLSRMTGELDKLIITLPEGGERKITPEQIERNIGISKEFNMWEFRTAVINKDVFKANQIMSFFNANPKNNPPIVTVSMLFNIFAQVMQAYYAPDRSQNGIAQHLEMQPWQVRDIITTMQHYSAMKAMLIIGKLREADTQLKGINKGYNTTDADIMKELLFFILH